MATTVPSLPPATVTVLPFTLASSGKFTWPNWAFQAGRTPTTATTGGNSAGWGFLELEHAARDATKTIAATAELVRAVAEKALNFII